MLISEKRKNLGKSEKRRKVQSILFQKNQKTKRKAKKEKNIISRSLESF